MSHWNYRIVRYADRSAGYGLHEVHYDDNGKEVSMTFLGARFYADPEEGPTAIFEMLQRALADAQGKPVLDEPAEWRK